MDLSHDLVAAFATEHGARTALALFLHAGLKPSRVSLRVAADAVGRVTLAVLELQVSRTETHRFKSLVAGAHGVVMAARPPEATRLLAA